MLRKKFFKILSVLVASIVTSSLFCFSAFAENNPYDYVFEDFTLESASVSIYDSSGNAVAVNITVYQPAPNGKLEFYADRVSGNFVAGEEYLVNVHLMSDSALWSSDNYVVGSYDITTWDYYQSITSVISSYRIGFKDSGNLDDTQLSENSPVSLDSNSMKGYKAYFKAGKIGYVYEDYVYSLRVKCNRTRDILGIFMYNFDFNVLTPDQVAANDLANGWTPGSSIDTGTIDDYESAEQELLGQTSDGRNATIDLFTDFSLSESLSSGLYACTSILTAFIDTDDSFIFELLSISLVIGAFGFVLGITPALFEHKIHFGKRSSDKYLGLPPRKKE